MVWLAENFSTYISTGGQFIIYGYKLLINAGIKIIIENKELIDFYIFFNIFYYKKNSDSYKSNTVKKS